MCEKTYDLKIVAFNPKQGRAYNGKKNPTSLITRWGFVFMISVNQLMV
jgi:hypothetical protein